MPAAPLPENEARRQAALESYELIGTEAEPVFNTIIRLAAELCEAPMAMVSLIDRNRQWFYARHGIELEETARVHSLCGYTILGNDLTEIPDTHADVRVSDSPLVTHGPRIRFYAAQPVTTAEGFNIGTVCVAGHEPKTLNATQRGVLVELAKIVTMLFEQRKGVLESERRLTHLATHDNLTMLPNRALGLDRLKRAIARAHRYGKKAALLFVDLDRFKFVNDRYGHAAGDAVLVEVARRLLALTRETDSVARWGGDEFLVVLTDLEDSGPAQKKRGAIDQRLRDPYEILGATAVISASVGVALYPEDGDDESALLHHADASMYDSKRG